VVTIPEGATVAEVVGETDILAGQDTINREILLQYANEMSAGTFPWEEYQSRQPMLFQLGANGECISQGHHRWVAARLAGVEIPVTINIRRDYWPNAVPYARSWADVEWE
jgi:hypothetical protein